MLAHRPLLGSVATTLAAVREGVGFRQVADL
jgi:hypothetical protein